MFPIFISWFILFQSRNIALFSAPWWVYTYHVLKRLKQWPCINFWSQNIQRCLIAIKCFWRPVATVGIEQLTKWQASINTLWPYFKLCCVGNNYRPEQWGQLCFFQLIPWEYLYPPERRDRSCIYCLTWKKMTTECPLQLHWNVNQDYIAHVSGEDTWAHNFLTDKITTKWCYVFK